jgi:hypothetical protein
MAYVGHLLFFPRHVLTISFLLHKGPNGTNKRKSKVAAAGNEVISLLWRHQNEHNLSRVQMQAMLDLLWQLGAVHAPETTYVLKAKGKVLPSSYTFLLSPCCP